MKQRVTSGLFQINNIPFITCESFCIKPKYYCCLVEIIKLKTNFTTVIDVTDLIYQKKKLVQDFNKGIVY